MYKEKILVVHNYYKIPGGEDTVVKNEITLLEENGHEVILYSRNNSEITGVLKKALLPFQTIFSIKTYLDIKNAIQENKIDIVHVHNTLPLISQSVYYAAKRCKVPVVQTLHNFRFLCPNATFTRENKVCEKCTNEGLMCSIKYKCYRGSYVESAILAISLKIHRILRSFKKVDAFIALTEFNKKKFTNIIEKDKIYVKPNFAQSSSELENNKRKYYIYAGRIDKLKGVDLLLRAWKDIPDETLMIVGTGPYLDEGKEFVKENKMNNVCFLGLRDNKDVIDLIREAKAVILPSQCYEGFPMIIVEGFSQGTPIIAGDIGNLAVIVENNINGIVFKYNSSDSLREKVCSLNIEDIQRLSKGAFKSYQIKYNKESNYAELIDIYKKASESI